MAPQDSKIAVEILQSINNRTQSLWEIVCYAWLLLTYIVIITTLSRLTLYPARILRGTMLLFLVSSFFCLSRSESGAPCVRGVYSSNTHCVASLRKDRTLWIGRFRRGLQRFFSFFFVFFFQTCYIVLTFVARWHL